MRDLRDGQRLPPAHMPAQPDAVAFSDGSGSALDGAERQMFTSFQNWVNKASRCLTSHPQYNDTSQGDTKGWRGHHFTAMCFDAKGRRCRNGGDFMRARDEGAFPVRWLWPDQLLEIAAKHAAIHWEPHP